MKRGLLLTSMLLLLMGLITHAQDLDVKPSQQAQGILEGKNGMVDHTTGLFHYKVPLYEIKSGNFTLPISLNYIAKGVKVKDYPGIVGYNWTLNTGGVVTRTIRGGIADEDWIGISRKPLSTVPTASEIEAVNKRERDGETDIFTVSFNGKNINFRIFVDTLNHLMIAEPLEKTNIKITCDFNREINTWIIVDEAGNKYTFGQKEWTSHVNREGITNNGIPSKEYISAWYLNKIEPIHGSEINFSYIKEVYNIDNQDSICAIKHYDKKPVLYNYGLAINECPYNFEKYRDKFNEYISEAHAFINMGNVEMQINGYVEMFINGRIMPNPFITSSVINTNFKVMGVLSDFSKISKASRELINMIDNLINTYKNHASTNIQMGVSFLEAAKSTIVECIVENVEINEKVEYNGESFEIRSPLLSKIECKDKIINFSYNKNINDYYDLDEINLSDINRNRIKGIKLYNDGNLTQISYLDSNRNEYDKIDFCYFTELGNDVANDLWGYYKEIFPTSGTINRSLFDDRVDLNNAKYRTLSTITTKTGSKITLEYESNVIREWRGGITRDYGGLRISKIIINESSSSSNDIINYYYPIGGISVYGDHYNKKSIYYPNYGFADRITHNNVIYDGNAYISLGNNSLYYPIVEEEFVGKGKNKYFFYMPTLSDLYYEFPYLLCGLPLSKEVYDKNNHLKSIMKFNYHTDETLSGLTNSNPETPNICAFNKKISQIKAYPYYVNSAKIEEYYRSLDPIPCGASIFINPYAIYKNNIKPRSNPKLPTDQVYEILYGGCVLLKEKIEYFFEDNSTEQSSSNCRKMEYYYDNFANSTFPIRTIMTKSDGSQEIEIIKRVTEMSNNVSSVINEMKSKNIHSPIIKTQKLIRKNSTDAYRLVEEDVYEYDSNENHIQLMKISRYNPTAPLYLTVQNPMIDNTLYGQSNYNVENTFNYQSYLPTYVTTLNETLLTKYDLSSDAIILTSKNVEENSIQAADKFNRYTLVPENNYLNFHQTVSNFYDDLRRLNLSHFPPSFRNYIMGDECSLFISAIEDIYFYRKTLSFDDFKSYTGKAVHNFINLYLAEVDYIPPFTRFRPDCLAQLSYSIDEINSDLLGNKYQHIISMDKDDAVNNSAGFLISNVCSNKYKVFLLNNSLSNGHIEYQISHSTGKHLGNSSFIGSSNWQLSVIDIDMNNFANIESLKILPISNTKIAYMAIVPSDAEFEATSYNADGTIFCKFNQNGQLERYEYDAVGRVTKVFDNDNNLLKEFKYNVVLPQ